MSPIILLLFDMMQTGGSSIDSVPPSKLSEWVKAHGGHTVIRKVSWKDKRLSLALPCREKLLGRCSVLNATLPPITHLLECVLTGRYVNKRYWSCQND